jgi:hypothetical protein
MRDMFAFDSRGSARFAKKAHLHAVNLNDVFPKYFDRDGFVKLDVVRAHDDAHPPFAENALDTVLSTEDLAD